jgi:hypothetical protein
MDLRIRRNLIHRFKKPRFSSIFLMTNSHFLNIASLCLQILVIARIYMQRMFIFKCNRIDCYHSRVNSGIDRRSTH